MLQRVLNTNGQIEWIDPDKVIKAYTIQEGIVVAELPDGFRLVCTDDEWERFVAKANGEEAM